MLGDKDRLSENIINGLIFHPGLAIDPNNANIPFIRTKNERLQINVANLVRFVSHETTKARKPRRYERRNEVVIIGTFDYT